MTEKPTPSDNLKDQSSNKDEKKNQSLAKKEEYKFLFNNRSFTVIIGMTEDKQYLNIQSKEEGVIAYLYENSLNLTELTQLDKQFRTCDDIEEAYKTMILIFKHKNNFIKDINDNKLILTINILNLDNSFREKNIELLKKSQSTEIIIENLCKTILVLNENNIKLQNELNEVKEKVRKLEDKINNEILCPIDSQIIKEKKDYDFIIERLKQVNLNQDDNQINEGPQNNNRKITLKLLYRATKDGDNAKDFHLKCDKIKNNIIVIKTKKGLRFGGFTCESWDGKGDKKDKNAFCFSLDKYKIYNWIKGKSSIFVSPESGPAFGNCIFEIKDKFFEMGGLCSEDYFYNNQENQCEINGGEEQFDIEDVEVFSVSF
jgi:hypothetical protein